MVAVHAGLEQYGNIIIFVFLVSDIHIFLICLDFLASSFRSPPAGVHLPVTIIRFTVDGLDPTPQLLITFLS